MNKKLIAIDVDRTLLKSDHTVSEQTRQFLSDLTDAGHIVVIATGRILSSARAVKDQLGLDISYVGCNGATIYDHIDKQVMADALDRDVVLKILDIFQKHDIYHHYYTEDVIYANRLAHTAKRFKIYEGTTTSVKHVKDIIIHDDLKETIDNNIVYKFGIFEDGTYDLNAVVEDLSKIDGIYPIYSNIGLLDVMKAGISKWTAIERLSKIHGIAPEDVINLH